MSMVFKKRPKSVMKRYSRIDRNYAEIRIQSWILRPYNTAWTHGEIWNLNVEFDRYLCWLVLLEARIAGSLEYAAIIDDRQIRRYGGILEKRRTGVAAPDDHITYSGVYFPQTPLENNTSWYSDGYSESPEDSSRLPDFVKTLIRENVVYHSVQWVRLLDEFGSDMKPDPWWGIPSV